MSPTVFSVDTLPSNLPQRPEKLQFEPIEENTPKLKQYLLEQFSKTTFNRDGPFPSMDTKPAHIHIQPDAKPHVPHNSQLLLQKFVFSFLSYHCKLCKSSQEIPY